MYAEQESGIDLLMSRMWLMHRSTIHCKLSGGVYAATEIKDAVPIIHGPLGCAYNHRITVQKPWLDTVALPTTALTENETVLGGIDRLRDTIIEVDQKYHPNLIPILLSCVSGIIGDDVKGEIYYLKNTGKVKADMVVADTSGFKHRDFRDWVETSIKNMIHNYRHPEDYKPFSGEGCGHVEVLNAFAEQLMEVPDNNGGVIEQSVNRWGGNREWDVSALKEKVDILTEMGVTINTIFFADITTEKIKNAPRAQLNIVQRPGEWEKIMRERGGARLGEIIHNARGAKDDAGVVYEFAERVGGTVIGDIPRSDLILKAETEMKTVIEAYPKSDIAARFMDLATRILENKDGVIPRMLSDEGIEELGKKIAMSGIKA